MQASFLHAQLGPRASFSGNRGRGTVEARQRAARTTHTAKHQHSGAHSLRHKRRQEGARKRTRTRTEATSFISNATYHTRCQCAQDCRKCSCCIVRVPLPFRCVDGARQLQGKKECGRCNRCSPSDIQHTRAWARAHYCFQSLQPPAVGIQSILSRLATLGACPLYLYGYAFVAHPPLMTVATTLPPAPSSSKEVGMVFLIACFKNELGLTVGADSGYNTHAALYPLLPRLSYQTTNRVPCRPASSSHARTQGKKPVGCMQSSAGLTIVFSLPLPGPSATWYFEAHQ